MERDPSVNLIEIINASDLESSSKKTLLNALSSQPEELAKGIYEANQTLTSPSSLVYHECKDLLNNLMIGHEFLKGFNDAAQSHSMQELKGAYSLGYEFAQKHRTYLSSRATNVLPLQKSA